MTMNTSDDWGDLETFKTVGTRLSTPMVTINSSRTIALNSTFVHDHKDTFDKNTHVLLSYSKAKHAIVFQFISDPTTIGAIKLTKRSNISIAARSFFKHYSLDIGKLKGRYQPKLENIPGKGDCWTIYLNENLSTE